MEIILRFQDIGILYLTIYRNFHFIFIRFPKNTLISEIIKKKEGEIYKNDIFGCKYDKKKKILHIYKNMKKICHLINVDTKDLLPSFDFGQKNILIKLIRFKESK
jgi:hypothetical protein